MAKGATAILDPHEEDRAMINPMYTGGKPMGGMGGLGDGGGFGGMPDASGGVDNRPGKWMGPAGGAPHPSTYIPPSTESIPAPPPKAVPDPIAAPPPPGTDAEGGKKIADAEQKIDEEQMHGFAANILAGGMFQSSTPELARNILLGN